MMGGGVPRAERRFEIKLGPGGLRDIEFAVQLLQLVHGRTDESVRAPATLSALSDLTDRGYVGRDDGEALHEAYAFLRTLEHRIQLHRLSRTHVVPEDEASLRRLGRSMGFTKDPVTILDKTWQHHRREVNTDLDLDGLAASHELVMTFSEPAIRRVRRRIELPMCKRPGTYVIDLIGNGMSSRAVVHKGRLRHFVRVGAAGHAVTVLDEAGQPLSVARAWLGDREYKADEHGTFIVVEYDSDRGNPWIPHPWSAGRWPSLAEAAGLVEPRFLHRVPSRMLGAIYAASARRESASTSTST